jgi:Family of unknown function (DUF5675)
MHALKLVRFAYAPFGTFGIMYAGTERFYTVEQPWRLNARQRSCVPEGEYQLIKHHSKKYPNSFALVNHDLGVHYQPGPNVPPTARLAILIHQGNTAADVSGCIAVGTSLGMVGGAWAVTNSQAAMTRLRELIATLPVDRIQITHVDTSRSVDDIPYGTTS